MSKKVAVMLGCGFEPIEAIAPTDIMRRAGIDVTLVSVEDGLEVIAAHNIAVFADECVKDIYLSSYDMLVIPGGNGGVERLSACQPLLDALTEFMTAGRPVAAICAGPTILADLHLLDGYTATCYPGCETNFPEGTYPSKPGVYTDRNLITASGPGYSLEFGKAIVAALIDEATAKNIAAGMLFE